MTKPTSKNKSSSVIPVRISLEQLKALQVLPEGVSISALARTLFALYLSGSLGDEFLVKLYDEVARTGVAIKNKQRDFAQKRREKGKSEPKSRATTSLRERILLSFNDNSRGSLGSGSEAGTDSL